MDNYKIKFGNRLKELRRNCKMTQRVLAEAAGVDVKYISRIETGKSSPSFDVITKLASALNVPLEILFHFPKDVTKEDFIKDLCEKIKNAELDKVKLISKIIDDILLF